MTPVILSGVFFVLLAGFTALCKAENALNKRVFGALRRKFDKYVERIQFLLDHVDFGSFIIHLFKDMFDRFVHFILHLALSSVRFVERLLTRGLKVMRSRIAPPGIPQSQKRSTFVETMSYFKSTLHKNKKSAAVDSVNADESTH
jgi:hypothetical protein